MDGFEPWERILNEERLTGMMETVVKFINERRILKLEKYVEHSLMTKMYRESERYGID